VAQRRVAGDVARGSLLGMVGQGWHMVAAFLLYAFLARRLGPALFGQWRVVLSLLAWFEVFVASGLVKVATREIAQRPGDAGVISRAAYLGQAAVSLAVFLVVQAVAGPVAALLGDPSLAVLVRIAALDIPLYGLFGIASAIVLGEQRYARQGIGWIVYATAKAVLIAALVAAGFSVAGALVGNALASLVGFAALVGRRRGPRVSAEGLWRLARGMLIASAPFLALSLLDGVGVNADLWLVSAIVPDAAAVGLYASAALLAEVPVFLFLGLDRVIFASVVNARAGGDSGGADRYATAAVRTAIVVTVFAVVVVASVGRQTIELVFSAAYAGAVLPLVWLMIAAMGRTVQATCSEVLMAQGRRRTALAILGGTVVLEVVAVAALTPRLGLVGAAAATAGSAGAAAVAAGVALRATTGARPLLTLTRSTFAGLAVGAALTIVSPSAVMLFVAVPVAAAAYVGLLRLSGEIGAADVASMRAAMGGVGRG